MQNPLPLAVDFFRRKRRDIPCSDGNVAPKLVDPPNLAPETKLLSIEDPKVRRILHDFFGSTYWPYLRDLLMQQITLYQYSADKQLMGSLSDPKDSGGRMTSFHGGRLKGGEEIKLIIERLKRNYGQ